MGGRGGSSGSKGIAYKFNEQREMYITKHVSKYAAKKRKRVLSLKDEEIIEHQNVSSFAASHVKRELKRLAKMEKPPKEKIVLWYWYHLFFWRLLFDGPDGIRTHGLCVANAALSQLSYEPKHNL